ncbi:hypothetical protein ACHAW5_011140, partial [Stephanodiscus triporus]
VEEVNTLTDGHRALKQCGQHQRVFFVSLLTDNRAYETSFKLIGPNDDIIALAPANGQTFQANTQYSFQYCVNIGYNYRWRLEDSAGDGLCCQNGKGTYRYGIDDNVKFRSNQEKTFTTVGVHTFKVPKRSSNSNSGGSGSSGSSGGSGSNGSSSNSGAIASSKNDDGGVERDDAWLLAHNVRRKKYHEQWGKTYVPLKWSPMLANQARQWANKLLDHCDAVHVPHESGISEGENMAKNIGSGDNGELKTTDQILNKWVEMEMGDGYPAMRT